MAPSVQRQVPEGYAALPITGNTIQGCLNICILFRREADPAQGHLVNLEPQIDARCLLGCLTDEQGSIHQWLEIVIQDVDRLAMSIQAAQGVLNNLALDVRWRNQSRAENTPPFGPLIWSGWEIEHPPPLLIDPHAARIVHPVEESSGTDWQLCKDDAALKSADLPIYSSTLHRYLWNPQLGPESSFVPATKEAPFNERCLQPTQAINEYGKYINLNLSCGLIRFRQYLSVPYDEFIDVLSGASWQGVRHGRQSLGLDEPLEKLHTINEDNVLGDGWLFQDHQGKWGRLVETMHLKLRALTDAFLSVQEVVKQTGIPLLNLNTKNFRVQLGDYGCGLPYLWSSHALLMNPGCAFVLPIESSEHKYFLRMGDESASIFQPASASTALQGRGTIRIRELLTETEEMVILTATLTTQERIQAAKNDLIWLRMELRQGQFDLFAHLEQDEAMASGEWRLRTIPMRLPTGTINILREATGVPVANQLFELLPLLSTPHDLYALAVHGVRTLLVNSDNTLPVALDELMSLAKQLAAEYEESTSLTDRIDAIFQRDPRWLESIGPHRLTHMSITPQEALDLVPADLWYDTLGLLIRMMPGLGPDSMCRDFADAPIGGIHRIFAPPLEELERLLRRTRSLIVIDWRHNREICGVLRQYAAGLQGDLAGIIS